MSSVRNENIYGVLVACCQAMGQQITVEAARLIAEDLEPYTPQQINEALRKLRRKGGRFSSSAILEQVESMDGRPSADLAWAEMPKDEKDSAVISNEMAKAWAVAYQQYSDGDTVGAQIAFKRQYALEVELSRDSGTVPGWFPSFGHDKNTRDDAIAKAADLGRLAAPQAIALLAHNPIAARAIAERLTKAGRLGNEEFLALSPPVQTVNREGMARVDRLMGPLRAALNRGRED